MPELQKVLGFSPRADVLLAREDGSRRIWIEFEVSRADPVANHAKFAAAHLFANDLENDVFLSMVSTHVVRGRRNLAAAMTGVMRRFGIRAFQTVLLPECAPDIVKTLNHTPPEVLMREGPPVEPEVERALSVCESVGTVPGTTIHFAGDALDVLLNLSTWNDDMESPDYRAVWGRRRVKYFVHDPWTGRFAPSKFCAYLPLALGPAGGPSATAGARGGMTVEAYSRIDGLTPAFDGTRAWHHLSRQLGFVVEDLAARPDLQILFHGWHADLRAVVPLHPEGPVVLSPPGSLLSKIGFREGTLFGRQPSALRTGEVISTVSVAGPSGGRRNGTYRQPVRSTSQSGFPGGLRVHGRPSRGRTELEGILLLDPARRDAVLPAGPS